MANMANIERGQAALLRRTLMNLLRTLMREETRVNLCQGHHTITEGFIWTNGRRYTVASCEGAQRNPDAIFTPLDLQAINVCMATGHVTLTLWKQES